MKHCQAQSQAKWQGHLSLQQGERAFTLIELLVVTIIVGILAAVSLPTFINQIGKARETEAKNQMGSLARAQQIFHLEKQVFANSLAELALTGSFNPKYYNYAQPMTVNIATQVEHKASALSALRDRVRNYATGIYYNNGLYTIIVCQSDEIGGTVNAPSALTGSCTGGARLQ